MDLHALICYSFTFIVRIKLTKNDTNKIWYIDNSHYYTAGQKLQQFLNENSSSQVYNFAHAAATPAKTILKN